MPLLVMTFLHFTEQDLMSGFEYQLFKHQFLMILGKTKQKKNDW